MSQLWEHEEESEESQEAPRWGCQQSCGNCSFSTLTNFHTFQNPKRRVLPSNSSVSFVAGWTLPTSSSVQSAFVPWLVQKGEWPQPAAVPSPFPSSGLHPGTLLLSHLPSVIEAPRGPPCGVSSSLCAAPPISSVVTLLHRRTPMSFSLAGPLGPTGTCPPFLPTSLGPALHQELHPEHCAHAHVAFMSFQPASWRMIVVKTSVIYREPAMCEAACWTVDVHYVMKSPK